MSSPDSCETVVIVGEKSAGNPQGVREINKSDFDPKIHELFEGVVENIEKAAAEVVALGEQTAETVVQAVEHVADAAPGWGAPPPA